MSLPAWLFGIVVLQGKFYFKNRVRKSTSAESEHKREAAQEEGREGKKQERTGGREGFTTVIIVIRWFTEDTC